MFAWVSALMLVQAAPVIPSSEIVVRGERAENALAKCLSRSCAVPEDVRLSMAVAEAQFGLGRYRDARDTLRQSISRTQGEAARYPRLVAALYEANATVNRHIGDQEGYNSAVAAQAATLRRYLPADDLQRRLLPLTLADAWLDRGNVKAAMDLYGDAQRQFVRQGDTRLAAMAGLRRVNILLAQKKVAEAREVLAAVPGDAMDDPSIKAVHAVLASRIAQAMGDEGSVDRLIGTLRTTSIETPILVRDGPPVADLRVRPRDRQSQFDLSVNASSATASDPIRWVDIGYLIRPDGTVGDVHILREHGDRNWVAPYVESLAQRRYAPMTLTDGRPGIYRVERLTRRARLAVPTGSFTRQPVGRVSVERQDLTYPEVASK